VQGNYLLPLQRGPEPSDSGRLPAPPPPSELNRLAAGNFGDCKSLRRGLFELRIDWGPGYRVYYAMIGRACVLLLCGGDKRKQSADIARALEYLKDYEERTGTS